MIDVASGTGQAFDATVAIGEASRAELEAAIDAARQREIDEEGPNRIRSLERKIEKQKQHLADAEAALAAEKAAQGV